jgi:type I restriction enzyme S subunit
MDMIKEMKIPSGYKNTILGSIPKEWDIMSLEEVAFINMGQSPDSNFYNENGEGLPLIQGNADMNDRRSIIRYYTSQLTKVCDEGDFILSVRAPVGSIGIAGYKSCIGRGVCSLKPKNIDKEYLYQILLNSELSWKKLEQGSTFTAIGSKEVKEFKIAIAENPNEQTAIANLLSTWDKAIQTTNTLIEQKQNRKKWLMQMLLTGKKRLKGFEKEKWVMQKISSIAKEVSIRNKEDKDLVVLSCTKYDGLVPSLEYFGRKIYSDDLTTYKIVPKSHFAYATNHIEEGSIGYQTKLELSLISPMYTVFKTDGSVDDIYLYRVLKSQLYIHEYKKRMEGSIDRRGGLRWEEFSKIKVPVPSTKEQNAISSFFVVVDKEIELVKSKLDQLKEQKKGLMQILLTGKKRLKVN